MSKIDFNWIASEALSNSDRLVTGWLSDGKYQGAEYVTKNPKRADNKAGSFKINLDTGIWSDFATDDGGADLIALHAFLEDKSQGDAAKDIAAELNIPLERSSAVTSKLNQQTKTKSSNKKTSIIWTPILPVPFDVNVAPIEHYKYGEPSRRWEYLDAQGSLLCYVCRFDVEPRKQIIPLTWCKSSTGKFEWRWKGLEAPRPVYNLDKLSQNVKAKVVFTEGEKAADAAQLLFPACIPTTTFNGVKGWKYADYSVLVDREVIFWRDNDAEGLEYARNVTRKLQSQGCTVKWFIIPDDAPAKWDAADAVDEGWTHDKIKQMANDDLLLTKPDFDDGDNDGDSFKPFNNNVPVNPATGNPWPSVEFGWEISNDGVFDAKKQVVCLRPVWVDALTINSGNRWGVVIKFFDHDWCFKTMTMPDEQLHEQAGLLGKELAASGLPVIPGKEKMLSRFIVMLKNDVTKRILASNRLGWYDSPESKPVFILPSQVLGDSDQEIVFQPDTQAYISETLHGKGDLEQWQSSIAKPCEGNPVLMFSLMMALAGPLLKLCQEQSGGFHLYGVTTGGKTTAAQVAASVWGCGADPQEGPEITSLRKWYLTGNALESIAEVHNDTLLTLDEISEVDPNELGRIIYQLAGGLSKGRANAGGGLRAMRTWRLLFFSTGEKSVRQILGQVGQSQKGGQRVRLPDIPADDIETGSRAIIVNTHGEVAKEFVQNLKLSCSRYYGLAGPVFAAYLIAQAEALGTPVLSGHLREELREIERQLAEDLTVPLPPEGSRVLRRFALIALAGIRAGQPLDKEHVTAQILPWSPEAIMDAIRNIRDRWLSDIGSEQSETDRGLSYLRDRLLACTDRFMDIGNTSAGRDIVGYRADEYYLLTKSGLQELCGEFDMNTLLKELRNKKVLKCEKNRLTHKAPTIKSLSGRRPNLYWISLDFIGEKVASKDMADYEAGLTQVKPMDFKYDEKPEIPF